MTGEDVGVVPHVVGAARNCIDELSPMGRYNKLDATEYILEAGKVYDIQLIVADGSPQRGEGCYGE